MKTFSIWLAAALFLYASLAGGWHLYLQENPHSLVVVLDSSYPMLNDWHKLQNQLQKFAKLRYTRFALITEKGLQHGWNDSLKSKRITAYAPRNFVLLRNAHDSPKLHELLRDADQVIFLTNAPNVLLEDFSDWQIVKP